MSEFHTVHLGQVNVYLLRGREGYLLVDAGFPRKEKIFFARLARERIEPGEVRLAVITHVHFDHVGSLKAIQAGTGCKVAVPMEEAEILERGEVAIPPGTRWFSKPFLDFARRSPRIKAFLRYSALKPDVLIPEDLSLEDFGFDARVIATPGHTLHSVSVLTHDGTAFVGDLAPNDLPFDRGPIFNSFGEDGVMMLRSWEKLLNLGVKTLLPAHGRPFSAARLEDALETWSKKLRA